MTPIKDIHFMDVIDYFRMQPKSHEATAADIYAFLSRNDDKIRFDVKHLDTILQESTKNDPYIRPDDFVFLECIYGIKEPQYRMKDNWWDYLNNYKYFFKDNNKADILKTLQMLIPDNTPVNMGYKVGCPDTPEGSNYELGLFRITFGRSNLPLKKTEHELLDECYEAVRWHCSDCEYKDSFCVDCELHEIMISAKKWLSPVNTKRGRS